MDAPEALSATPPATPWSGPAAAAPAAEAPGDPPAARGAARPPHRLPGRRPARWAALLAWVAPGAGHAFLGRPGAGLVLLVVLCGTFATGLTLTDATCVDPHAFPLEFAAQALIGGPTGLALHFTRGRSLERLPPWVEVGRLYVVVAGLLNLVAVCDAVGEAWRRDARRAALVARQQARAGGPPPWEASAAPTAPTAPGAGA